MLKVANLRSRMSKTKLRKIKYSESVIFFLKTISLNKFLVVATKPQILPKTL